MIPAEKFKGRKIILFGELHGTHEIQIALTEFFRTYPYDFAVCIEIPQNIDHEAFLSQVNDGRAAWKKLLQTLSKRAIPTYCIDVEAHTDQESRERALADNVLRHTGKQLFVLTGDVHASTKPVRFGNRELKTMGYFLKQKVPDTFSVQLTARSGYFFNVKKQEILWLLARPEYFDHVVEFENVTAYVPN